MGLPGEALQPHKIKLRYHLLIQVPNFLTQVLVVLCSYICF